MGGTTGTQGLTVVVVDESEIESSISMSGGSSAP